jgi:hypothetical protein
VPRPVRFQKRVLHQITGTVFIAVRQPEREPMDRAHPWQCFVRETCFGQGVQVRISFGRKLPAVSRYRRFHLRAELAPVQHVERVADSLDDRFQAHAGDLL